MTKTEFQREERYVVFKLSDIADYFYPSEISQLFRLSRTQQAQRAVNGKLPLECVVVESDWPEYEPTWKAIEARVMGAQPAPSINEGVRKVTLSFRWESEAQHHIPTIEIEFDPVSPNSPNDAKGWQDRDRIASMLSPEAKP